MPIQINQLIIRTTITDDANAEKKGKESTSISDAKKAGKSMKNEIVKECVDQVMEILREQQER